MTKTATGKKKKILKIILSVIVVFSIIELLVLGGYGGIGPLENFYLADLTVI